MKLTVFFLFILSILFFSIVGGRVTRDGVESRLEAQVAEALSASDDPAIQGLSIDFVGLHGFLTGEVGSEETREGALRSVRRAMSFGHVRNRVSLREKLEPELEAVFRPGNVELRGRVPREQLKLDLREALRESGSLVQVSELEVTPDVPNAAWLQELPSLLRRFSDGMGQGSAGEGELVLSGKTLVLRREMVDVAKRNFLSAQAEQMLPEGYEVRDEMTLVDLDAPFELRVQRGGDGVWSFTGAIPDKATETELLQAFQAASEEDAKWEWKLIPQMDRPAWLGELPGFLRDFIRKVKRQPELWIQEEEVVLRGEVDRFEDQEALLESATRLFGPSMKIDNRILRAPGSSTPEPEARSTQREEGPGLRVSLSEGLAEVSGVVPSLSLRSRLVSDLRRLRPLVEDELGVDEGMAEAAWLRGLGGFLQSLGDEVGRTFELEVRGREASLRGEVRSRWAQVVTAKRFEAFLGGDHEIFDRTTIASIDDERRREAEDERLYRLTRVTFTGRTVVIPERQQPRLARLEQVWRQAGEGAEVLVQGYSAGEGTAAGRQGLATQRARAVASEIVMQGVPQEAVEILEIWEGAEGNEAAVEVVVVQIQ